MQKQIKAISLTVVLLTTNVHASAEDVVMCIAAQNSVRQQDNDRAITLYSRCIEFGELNRRNLSVALNNRGNIKLKQSKYNQAIEDFNLSLNQNPTYAKALSNRGIAQELKGFYGEAISDFRDALTIDPKLQDTQNRLAWIKATCPVGSLRDGDLAVKLAFDLNESTGWSAPSFLDTLAAAYAEKGDFGLAQKFQSQALDLMRQNNIEGQDKDAQIIRLGLYKLGKPYREALF